MGIATVIATTTMATAPFGVQWPLMAAFRPGNERTLLLFFLLLFFFLLSKVLGLFYFATDRRQKFAYRSVTILSTIGL